MPSISSSKSRLMYSTVLDMKARIWAAMPALALIIAVATESAVCTVPFATMASPRNSVSPSSRTSRPSPTLSKTSGPTSSISGTPASTRSCGPRFGYRPVMLGAALMTAATWQLTSDSALTRSRSAWSMIAISPGRSRLVRVLVRRSSLAGPASPGRSGAAATLRLASRRE